MIINCPICGGQLTITPQHFGQNVNCPHCARVFQVPVPAAQPLSPAPHQPGQPMPASPVPPHLQQATAPTPLAQVPGQSQAEAEENATLARYREKREKSTTAMIIGVVVLALGVPALIGLIVFLVTLKESSQEAKEERRAASETRKTAIRQAQNNLSVRGFKNLKNVKVSGDRAAPVVTGEAEREGEIHDFECKFRITETSDKIAWSVDYIEVGGQVIYRSE